MIEPENLKAALDQLVKDPSLKMLPDGTTFCNVGLHRLAAMFDCTTFDKDVNGKIEPMMAKEIIEYVENKNPWWIVVEGKQAADYAQRGGWAISFMKIFTLDDKGKPTTVRAPHDHVATVYPAPLQISGSLGRNVPLVANIGKRNAVMKSSEAFPVAQGEARYAILLGG